MKLNENQQFSQSTLIQSLYDWTKKVAVKVNTLASGRISAAEGTATAAPTTGTWSRGDFVRNSAPAEAGSASSKYVVMGWVRITDGSGNVLNTDWVACRVLTGN